MNREFRRETWPARIIPSLWNVGAALLMGAVTFGGCSKDKLNELADKAKQAVAEQTEKVTESVKQQAGIVTDAAKEQLALAGSCEVTLDTTIAPSACYVDVISQGTSRPQVLQMRSYRDPSRESFPSIMLQAQLPAGNLSQLVGRTVSARLFVQQNQDAPVWFCPTGMHVDLKIVKIDHHSLEGEIVGGSLRNSRSGADQTVTGKFTGTLTGTLTGVLQ